MNQLDIKRIVQDCFKQFYRADFETILGDDHPAVAVRRYAVSLWDVRNPDEIERDETHGVVCMLYIEWCLEKFREIRQDPGYQDEVDSREIALVKTSVCIWAAIDFKENPGLYIASDCGDRVEHFARHLWLSRNGQQVSRDKRLGIIQADYITWVAGELSRFAVAVR